MNEIGWSPDKSVPRLSRPTGMVVTPFCIVMVTVRLLTLPSATVPSWQLKHSREEPLGCGTVTFKRIQPCAAVNDVIGHRDML